MISIATQKHQNKNEDLIKHETVQFLQKGFTLGDQLVDHNNRTSGEKRSRVRTGSINIQQTTFQSKTF